MPSVLIAAQMAAGSALRRHTWVPPAAVTAHGKHQPLQWNIGSDQRNLVRGVRRAWVTIASDCRRSEEHTSELQSLMRLSYAVFCLKTKNKKKQKTRIV